MSPASRAAHGRETVRRMTAKELLSEYAQGARSFSYVQLDNEDLSRVSLEGASFYYASLRSANFSRSMLTYVQFKGADLTGACFENAHIGGDCIAAKFVEANLRKCDLTGATLSEADLSRADLTSAWFNSTTLDGATLTDAKLTDAALSHVHLNDLNVGPFCEERSLEQRAPSSIDSRTVMKSYKNPGLKRFMIDCGVPDIFASYMIDCARALDEPLLKSLMQSTFISYGAPDEKFARKLYEALRAHNVVVFFFPETAKVGERVGSEVHRRIQEQDRVLLVCSCKSLDRPGVLNEIQETLDREARDGGASYLLPIMLDDYVLTSWRLSHPQLAERVASRVIGDFTKARNGRAFEKALCRVVNALKKTCPS